ncbi:MAG: hypothetical protein ACYCOO_11725, partial [Chitinophagaceae bacterium]
MLLRTKGISINIEEPIVGRVTWDPEKKDNHSILIWEDESPLPQIDHFQCILTTQKNPGMLTGYPNVFKVPSFGHLMEGDLIVVGNDGNIKTLYRVNSFHNTLMTTERCN